MGTSQYIFTELAKAFLIFKAMDEQINWGFYVAVSYQYSLETVLKLREPAGFYLINYFKLRAHTLIVFLIKNGIVLPDFVSFICYCLSAFYLVI